MAGYTKKRAGPKLGATIGRPQLGLHSRAAGPPGLSCESAS